MNLVEFFNVYFFAIFFVAILSFSTIFEFRIKGKYPTAMDKFFFLTVIIFFTLFFGLRPENIGADTSSYIDEFRRMSQFDKFENAINYSKIARDYIFVYFTFLTSQFMSTGFYILTLTSIFMGTIYFLIKKLTSKGRLIFIFTFLCFGFFYSMGINIVRSGICAMFSLLGTIYLLNIGHKIENKKERVIKGFVFLFLGYIFHFSAIIFLLAYLVVRFFKLKIKWYYLVTMVFYVLAYLEFSIKDLPIIGPMIESAERLVSYLSGEASQEASGFNLYVIAFQTLGLLYGFYFVRKYKDKEYILINKIYLFLTCGYLFCLEIPYSDRFGVLSWVWLPLILCHPFINRNTVLLNKDFEKYVFASLFYLFLTYYRLELN